jgi:hypothetical protein
MDQQLIDKEVNKLINISYTHPAYLSNFEKAEILMDSYLEQHPTDTYMWFRLAILVYWPPIADYIKAMNCMKRILSYDPNNAYAVVVLTTFLKYNMTIDNECFGILCNIQTNDKEIQAMIELAKAWYFEGNNNAYFEHIKKARSLWQEHAKEFLAKYSCDNRDQNLNERVRANLQKLCKDYPTEPYDPLSIEQFLNEFVRSEL